MEPILETEYEYQCPEDELQLYERQEDASGDDFFDDDFFYEKTMSLRRFFTWHIIWVLAIYPLYRLILIYGFFGSSTVADRWMLFGTVLVSIGVYTRVAVHEQRNADKLISDVSFPFVLFTFIGYCYRDLAYGVVVGGAFALVVLFLLGIAFSGKPRHCSDPWIVFKKRVFDFLVMLRPVVSMGLLMVIALTGVYGMIEDYQIQKEQSRLIDVQTAEEWTVSNKIRELSGIEKQNWEKKSLAQRMELMQTVANIARNWLNIPYELTVEPASLERDVRGNYQSKIKKIQLNRQTFETIPAETAVNVVMHEVRHAYQHAAVEAMMQVSQEYRTLHLFEDANEFQKGYSHYTTEDDEAYRTNEIEVDARAYAEQATHRLYEEMELAHLAGGNE